MPTIGSSFYSSFGMIPRERNKIDDVPRYCPEKKCYGTIYKQDDGYWKCNTCGQSWLGCPTENKIY